MAILVDENTSILVQGITGKSGSLQTKSLVDYGSRVLAGVTPGRGGQEIWGVPVFDFASAAAAAVGGFDAAISYVPPMGARDAAFEAIDCGVKLLVLTMEGIPKKDVLDILAYAAPRGVRVLGPGTAGVTAPGKCKLGAHPARMCAPGPVGIVSKSGALSYEIIKTLTDSGLGQSATVALGGGPVWGITQRDVVELFNADDETRVIVLLGEIGGNAEIEAADYIACHVRKPVVSLITGRSAPEGKSLGHAGAIVRGNRGTAASKTEALEKAGARIARSPREVVLLVQESLQGR